MIIENEPLLLFVIEIKPNIQTCKKYVQPRTMETEQMTSFFHLFFLTPSICGIDLYLKIFKINFCAVPSDLKSA